MRDFNSSFCAKKIDLINISQFFNDLHETKRLKKEHLGKWIFVIKMSVDGIRFIDIRNTVSNI